MYSKNVQFKNKQDLTLDGNIDFPIDKKPLSYALFAHFFTGSKNFTAVRNISKALTQNRIAVMRFDFSGLGKSEGKFEDSNFSTNIDDLISAANFLKENYESPKIIVGHSLGGAAGVFAANEIESIQAIVTIGAPSNPSHVEHLFDGHLENINLDGEATFEIGGRPFTIKKHFLEDLSSKNMTKLLQESRKPILVLHSPQDKIVEIANAKEIYNAAHHPKSFISLDGANHLLTNKEDSFYVGQVLASWAKRYVLVNEEKELSTDKQTVVRIGRTKYSTEIVARTHSILADEPKKFGGKDSGLTPYELLLASLGSCTAITLRMYADRKKWDLDEVLVHLEHFKQHAEDCLSCEESPAKIDKFVRTIELIGDLTFEERKRLIQIANRCPVHRTLENKIEIETILR
ncbi:alpha/beta fold hydrolase [Aureibaculum sp. 2210JD6-5]|uniref:bifunctional alpha/beta hydrolase/OsmC family protein n=1 Tax=Aureibaculum sp. 2210JD6-5 TaxID=3103957 RepID=UPI002AAEE3BB|nr:alpha/beta fold hydrolase [Aureibaculum sp. 2210JD6-5]MDY7395692.1 alpha/beta fold hydrolase [Aureibaculum sp. 2210JD6-5]